MSYCSSFRCSCFGFSSLWKHSQESSCGWPFSFHVFLFLNCDCQRWCELEVRWTDWWRPSDLFWQTKANSLQSCLWNQSVMLFSSLCNRFDFKALRFTPANKGDTWTMSWFLSFWLIENKSLPYCLDFPSAFPPSTLSEGECLLAPAVWLWWVQVPSDRLTLRYKCLQNKYLVEVNYLKSSICYILHAGKMCVCEIGLPLFIPRPEKKVW